MMSSARIFLALILFAVAGNAQVLTPDQGRVKNGVYRSDFFSFVYTYPEGWTVHGKETGDRIMEIGTEKAKESRAMSDAAAKVVAKHTYQLLTVFRYALGTPGVKNASVQIIAEDVRHAPAITDGKVYLLNMAILLKKMGITPEPAEPVEITIGGRKFFRLNSTMEINGTTVYSMMTAAVARGYAYGFVFTVADKEQMEELITTLDSVEFIAPARRPRRR